MLIYCKRCVMPHTKPDLHIDNEGICNACRSYEQRTVIDWDARMLELKSIVDRFSSKDSSRWDCIVPVSGGKDSTYQVVRMLQLGMIPLCVTSTTCDLSNIGRKNSARLWPGGHQSGPKNRFFGANAPIFAPLLRHFHCP